MRAADSKLAARLTWLATQAAGRVSSRLAGPITTRLWFTPWRVPVGERATRRQAEWLRGTERVTFEVDGRRIVAYAAGDGPPVLLVHGWGERGASLGAFVEPLTTAGYRVVGVDLPGHGASEGGQVDGFELAAAIARVCESLGGVHAVVAHSMGATTSLYAASRGAPTDALALLAPSPRLDHALVTFSQMLRLPPKAVAGLKATIERRYGADVWDRLSTESLTEGVDGPVLIVHDRDDPQVALADAETLHAALPASRLVTTDGLGHGRILRDPKVIEAVTSFLGEVTPVRRTAGAGA
ncbi:MAG TPA: alpha/beta fold hydrolase [Actinomycetota bacterium]|nr:alpha/beta fold hydrolase [Actinomycetota bacterium]